MLGREPGGSSLRGVSGPGGWEAGATPLTALGLCFLPLGGGQDSPAHPLGASGFDALWSQMLPQPPSARLPPLPHALPTTALQCQIVASVTVVLTTHSGLLFIIHAPEEEKEWSSITCTSEHLPWVFTALVQVIQNYL